MKNIPGFATLKAYKHGYYWYIIDCTVGCGDPFKHSIGGYFLTYGLLVSFAQTNYYKHYR